MKLMHYKNTPTVAFAYPYESFRKHSTSTNTLIQMPAYRTEYSGTVDHGSTRKSGLKRKGIGAAIVAALMGKNPPLRRSFRTKFY